MVFLASEWLGVFSKIYPELFPASPGAQLQEVTVSTFFDPTGSIRLHFPIGSKKTFVSIRSGIVPQLDWKNADGDLLQLPPWRSGKQLWMDLGKKLQVVLRRGRPISNMFGAKAHANVLRGTFSTDYKSNCIIIGLKIVLLTRVASRGVTDLYRSWTISIERARTAYLTP